MSPQVHFTLDTPVQGSVLHWAHLGPHGAQAWQEVHAKDERLTHQDRLRRPHRYQDKTDGGGDKDQWRLALRRNTTHLSCSQRAAQGESVQQT